MYLISHFLLTRSLLTLCICVASYTCTCMGGACKVYMYIDRYMYMYMCGTCNVYTCMFHMSELIATIHMYMYNVHV